MTQTTSSTTSTEFLFGETLDDLMKCRAAQAGRPERCGGCGNEFPTMDELFSHPCDYHLDPLPGHVAVQVEARPSPRPAGPQQVGGNARQRSPQVDEPVDPAKVEAWLRGLGRKVEDRDVTARVEKAAREWIIRQDIVRGEFMGQMQERAEKGWRLSVGQVRGIMNLWRADVLRTASPQPVAAAAPQAPAERPARTNKFAGRCPNCHRTVEAEAGVLENVAGKWVVYHREGECPVVEFTATDGTKVPEGRYAYETEEGIKFFQLIEGRVYVQASDELHPVPGGGQAIIDRIATDPETAARLYGREIGKCCRCGRTLTSEWREQGIGPKCAAKAGW